MSEAATTTTTTTTDPAAAAAAATTTGAKPWYDGADAELVGHIQTKGWHDKPANVAALEAIKAHREAEKYIGADPNHIIKLPTSSDPAELRAALSKIGVPADPKEYDFSGVKFSDGTEPDASFTEWLRTQAHELNVPKDAASRLGQAFVKYLEGNDASALAERTATLQEEHKVLDANWGQNKEVNTFLAKKGAEALGFKPEHVDALEGVVGYATIMEALRKVGSMNGEAAFIGGGNGPNGTGGVMTREQAVARLAELKADTAWVKRYMDGGATEGREMAQLNQLIAGQE